jgi:hypothetical protein
MEMMYAQAFNILPGLEKPILIPGMFLNLILEQIENKARANMIHGRYTASVFRNRLRALATACAAFLAAFCIGSPRGGAFAFRN